MMHKDCQVRLRKYRQICILIDRKTSQKHNHEDDDDGTDDDSDNDEDEDIMSMMMMMMNHKKQDKFKVINRTYDDRNEAVLPKAWLHHYPTKVRLLKNKLGNKYEG